MFEGIETLKYHWNNFLKHLMRWMKHTYIKKVDSFLDWMFKTWKRVSRRCRRLDAYINFSIPLLILFLFCIPILVSHSLLPHSCISLLEKKVAWDVKKMCVIIKMSSKCLVKDSLYISPSTAMKWMRYKEEKKKNVFF